MTMYRRVLLSVAAGLALGALQYPAQADNIVLAEYRADRDGFDVSPWNNRVQLRHDTRIGDERPEEPSGLISHELLTSIERAMSIAGYSFSGVVDVAHSENSLGGQPYGRAQSVRVGPRFSLTPSSSTMLYYGVDDEQMHGAATGYAGRGSGDAVRTGLEQVWYLADHRAELRLGYEFEQARVEEIYEEARGHSVNLSGRFPLFWGLRASVAADYGRYAYQEFNAGQDVAADRLQFRAAVGRYFVERLYATLNYSYLDEDFDEASLSSRRQSWGLNLRYEY